MIGEQSEINIKQIIVDSLPFGVICTDIHMNIMFVNNYIEDVFKKNNEIVIGKKIEAEFQGLFDTNWKRKDEKEKTILTYYFGNDKFIVQKSPFNNGDSSGYIILFFLEFLFENITSQLDSYKNLSLDLQAIFDISYDVIYVTDGNGKTLRVSQACERLWGYKQEDLVGKTVYDLEKKGVYRPSAARLVLEKGEKITTIQTTKTGRRLMVVARPIKDNDGKITRVINASRDITEIDQLQNELNSTKMMIEGYKKELSDLREKDNEGNRLIYRCARMKNIVSLAMKVAKVNSTVLLLGETGVGKEVFASFIHNQSPRINEPFITINCGALTEDLLEEEIFGAKTILPSGETKNTPGLIELANKGTLFLDEIGEMPMSLQVKLLRVFSEQEITKKGDKTPIKVDVRIIAATNHDLIEDVQNKKFRKDLFYRLNVVPITIPSLKDREEDILPLCMYFLKQFNEKYNLNKNLSQDILEVFLSYDWPGNVRELENIIERLVVMSEKALIGLENIPNHIKKQNEIKKAIHINKIIPLKIAIELLEKEMLELAQEQHKSTTKIAQVLGLNQSTVSRKIQKYFK